jgi:hypothetical protein
MAIWITALGIVFSGFRASDARVVALSNPTKLNSASTNPSRNPLPFIPVKCSCFQSQCRANRTNTKVTKIAISVTDSASIHSISRAEIFTSRQATAVETTVTLALSRTV